VRGWSGVGLARGRMSWAGGDYRYLDSRDVVVIVLVCLRHRL
jgi:hypothetical protein